MNNVYMGFDRREVLAYEVAKSSILRRCSTPIEIVPLKLNDPPVSRLLTSPVAHRDGKMWCQISQAPLATEFAVSRFVVPFFHCSRLALFVDCDIVCLADVTNRFALAEDRYAVQVVGHDHRPRDATKMDGQVQTAYARKNWSSVVLWNCGHPSN